MPATSRSRRAIELILTDVDGVLTDGALLISADGLESKRFHVRDGAALKWWRETGGHTGIISGRSSRAVEVRASELGIDFVHQGVKNKLEVAQGILEHLNLSPDQVCFIGDDLQDLAVMEHCGLAAAPADACLEVRQAADYVSVVPGGHGAVRDVIEMILKKQSQWTALLRSHQ
ncbi:MAG: HAD hydrolase family protein [Planctomycetales bacterium]